MEFKMMNPNEIEINDYNPNEMIDSVFNHLKAEIERVGFIDPVAVRRKEDEKLVVVDGEHRLKAAKDVGLQQIPVIILDINEDEAKLQTINLNQIKGEINPIKFAKLLDNLSVKFSDTDLTNYLALSEAELKGYKALMDSEDINLEESVRVIKDKPTLNEIKLILDDEQFDIVDRAIQKSGVIDRTDAMISICKTYLGE